MNNRSLRSSRSLSPDRTTQPLRAKWDLSMKSNSSEHCSDMDVDVPQKHFQYQTS